MIIGIDTGTKFIKLVHKNTDGGVMCSLYKEHQGNPERDAADYLKNHPLPAGGEIRLTGVYADRLREAISGTFTGSIVMVEEIQAVIAAARRYAGGCRYIVNVGAGSIMCIMLDGRGNFRSYRENSLCAAGTGSFLDEQMRRMDFDCDTLASLAPVDAPPEIATRCAVFAKSDLIHRQQEGYSKEEMWSGLCRGVVSTMLSTLFRGNVPDEKILFCGGTFRNAMVRDWVRKSVPRAVFHEQGHLFSAIGALLVSPKGNGRSVHLNQGDEYLVPDCMNEQESPSSHHRREKGQGDKQPDRHLTLRLSTPPDFSAMKEYIRDGNEVRLHREPDEGARTALGMDIGSTSTKCVLINADTFEVYLDIYRKTGGDPLRAAGALLRELALIIEGKDVEIVRSATTGSGRRLAGEIMGADLIINEITAHFSGATHFHPGMETVFEIGGQDSKYIRGSGGAVADSAMNFVCAAGTGSFIEEQAARLGFDVREIGDITLGKRIPHTSDRCTVFMEQDINKLLREGYTREEALAGVLHSIAKNYLHRVVGTRPVTGDTVFFQGATARNRGLVAAFELILKRKIVVSPYCHVMGALGAAILACERTAPGAGRFRGLGVFARPVRLEYRRCGDCANACAITLAHTDDGNELSWGFMCGREGFGGEKKHRRGGNHLKRVEALAYEPQQDALLNRTGSLKNAPPPSHREAAHGDGGGRGITIGIPMVLSMYNYLPLWRTFFEHLGFTVKLPKKSNQAVKESAARIALSDFCFPMKMALAHMNALAADGVDAVFFPSVISEKKQENNLPRIFCPYVISYPSLSGAAGPLPAPIISPSMDFRIDEARAVDELSRAMEHYHIGKKEIRGAYRTGKEALDAFLKEKHAYGRRLLAELGRGGKKAIVFMGRPYNLYDGIINMGLPERFREYGVEILPYECLMDPADNGSDVHHMYWHYGERILALTGMIREAEGLFPVYFTNFGCGPDSFVLSRFEKAMGNKPYLIIELDEHGSETGYLTRIEAFMDVVMSKAARPVVKAAEAETFHAKWKRRGKKLWIPPMHEISGRLTAAGFRAWGFDSEALPAEDAPALETGRQGVRGSECLPAHTTIGVFLKKLKEIGARPEDHALFMPTAEGPCRFGQYVVLHRSVLDRNGFGETAIFSPSSVNSYMGMPNALRSYLWDILISGDMLMKYICKTRPYEKHPGGVDARAEEAISILESDAEKKGDLMASLRRAISLISSVPVHNEKRPLVGVVGEIYVRCNPFCNNNLIRHIEAGGGEAWLSPISEWVLYTAWMERYLAKLNRKNPVGRTIVSLKTSYLFNRIHKFEKELSDYLHDRYEPPVERILGIGEKYLPLIFEGEAILTAGRTVAFLEDGADMVVNAAPFGCMPGNITQALFHRLQEEHGRPVLTLFYDGQSDINRNVGVYLRNLGKNYDAEDETVSA